MLRQLRIYRIEEGKYDEFLRMWTTNVYTTRIAQGWHIQAWSVPERNELVWILSRDCTLEEWNTMEQQYYASPERMAVKPDPAQFIVDGEDRWLTPLEQA